MDGEIDPRVIKALRKRLGLTNPKNPTDAKLMDMSKNTLLLSFIQLDIAFRDLGNAFKRFDKNTKLIKKRSKKNGKQ